VSVSRRLSIAFAGAALAWGSTAAIASPDCTSALDSDLNAAIAAADISSQASWGVSVRSLDGAARYESSGDRAFVPASNVKLLTTAAALLQLGETWQTRTEVYWNRDRLILRGRGDPTIASSDLDALAQQVADRLPDDATILHLVLDDGYFQGDTVDPHWEWEDAQAGYGAPVNATIVDRNAIPLTLVPRRVGRELQVVFERDGDEKVWQVRNESQSVADTESEWLRVGRDWLSATIVVRGQLISGAPPEPVAVSVPDPSANALAAFQRALADRDIEVAATSVRNAAFGMGRVVASRRSPPLRDLVATINRASDNLYAEALLRHLGAQSPANSNRETTRELGLREVRSVLGRELGLDGDRYVIQDGSGLSRQNSIAPDLFVDLLDGMMNSPVAESFLQSLPVLGESGTLANWRPLASGATVRAKTGSMTGIYALSGYLIPPGQPVRSPETLAFSLVVNHSDASFGATRSTIAALLDRLDRFQQCRARTPAQNRAGDRAEIAPDRPTDTIEIAAFHNET